MKQVSCQAKNMKLANHFDKLWDVFLQRIRAEIDKHGRGAAASIARRLGVASSTVTKWCDGTIRTAKVDDFLRYMDALGIKLEDVFSKFEPGTCGYGYVRKVQAKLGAGSSLITNGDLEGMYAFRQDFINEMGGNPDALVMFDVLGVSMEPTIPDGSTVLVHLRDTSIRSGLVYAVRVNDELLVKRLIQEPGRLVCHSDNPTFGDTVIDGENPNFEVFGRVRWFAKRM